MSRPLRALLLGSIAVAYVYLLAHVREPIRLNVGDPSSDASTLMTVQRARADGLASVLSSPDSADEIDNPPLSRIVFSAAGEVLGDDVRALRPLALVFAVLASWFLFGYTSRLYDRRVGLIATTLFSTSQLWLAHADSIHQAPLVQCAGFLALWGTVRAIETRQLRHYVAVGVGSGACLLAGYDYYLLLPVGVIATIYAKVGRSVTRDDRRIVATCVAGCVFAIAVTCVLGHVPRIAHFDHDLGAALPTVARRAALGFTPFFSIVLGYHVIRAIRAPTIGKAAHDVAVWMLVVAAIWLLWFDLRATSQLIGLQVLMPFYAIGSAALIARMLDGSVRVRTLALAWLVAAPLWSFYWTFTHARAWLDRDDVSEMTAYLAENDTNDFVMSDLLDYAPLEATIGRRAWDAFDARDATEAPSLMMKLFELTGTDAVHAVVFTDPSSRFVERSLSSLAVPRRLWSVTGWPQVARHKTEALIYEYDRRVLANLNAVHATKVLQLRHLAIYRIDRAATRAALEDAVQSATHIDFDTVDAPAHELLGWDPFLPASTDSPGTTLRGFWRCPARHCKTVRTDVGLVVPEARWVQAGQVMVRLDRTCDHVATAAFVGQSEVQLAVDGVAIGSGSGSPVTATIPATSGIRGIDVVELENLRPSASGLRVLSIDLASDCGR
ncbi:MAG TPA: glycosyltransferase family 39 protein [Kofleriaceae bacterium]|nr:glycosyltransferase family 39 protein [Kofleriaceae bacterium]